MGCLGYIGSRAIFMTYDLRWTCLYVGSPCNVQNVLALVDTGVESTVLFSKPTKFQGPTAVMNGYDEHSIHVVETQVTLGLDN
jgi:hypothetical protein